MRFSAVDKTLRTLRSQLDKRNMVEAASQYVLPHAIGDLRDSWKEYCRSNRETWGYEIDSQHPLVFRKTLVDGYSVQPDLYCRVQWEDPDETPKKYELVLRVWAYDPHVVYRDGIDAPEVEEQLASLHAHPKRVMCRYHFDYANPGQAGPLHHLQIGGTPQADECTWLFNGISVPRLMFPPVDLILATEIIIANFFDYDVGRRLLKDPVWKNVVFQSQHEFLEPYYRESLDVLDSGEDTLLLNWWNSGW